MRVLAVISACFALSGCLEATSTSQNGPKPGSSLISPSAAGALFARACIENLPDFSNMPNDLPRASFAQAPATGTYFHQRYNLSINADAERCSLIFGSNTAIDTVVAELANGTLSVVSPDALPRNIDITSNEGTDGLRYFRMVLPSQD